jgi:hypothetical protein
MLYTRLTLFAISIDFDVPPNGSFFFGASSSWIAGVNERRALRELAVFVGLATDAVVDGVTILAPCATGVEADAVLCLLVLLGDFVWGSIVESGSDLGFDLFVGVVTASTLLLWLDSSPGRDMVEVGTRYE